MSDFKVLTDAEHVVIRKQLYCGEDAQVKVNGYFLKNEKCEYTELEINPALCKIVNEIIDNAVDDHIRTDGKYSTKIDVVMKPTLDSFEVKVSDNGKGIPVKLIESENEYQPALCWGRAKAGSNFDNVSANLGTFGIGSFLTYVFSESFIGETHDGTNKLIFKKPHQVFVSPSKKHGTSVTFVPDISHFSVVMNQVIYKNHEEFIKQRLVNLSICYPKINFTFNGENVSVKTIDNFAKSINDDYVTISNDKFSIIISTTAEIQEFRHHCYLNGLYNTKGGSPIDYISNQLANALIPLIKKKYKIDVSTGQIKNNLFIGLFGTGFVNLKFDSQTKERVTNSAKEVADYFDYDFAALAKKVMHNEAIIDPIVKAILFKKAQAENLELARQQRKSKNEKVLNHIPATFKNANECSCFIVEGLCMKDDTEILILEENSIKAKFLKEVNIGDYVLTHNHRFKQITSKTYSVKATVKIKCGDIILEVSPEHKFPVYDINLKEVILKTAIDINPLNDKFLKNKIIYSEGFFDIKLIEHINDGVRIVTEISDYVFSLAHEVLYWETETLSIKNKKAELITYKDYLIL